MTGPGALRAAAPTPPDPMTAERAKLRQAAHQLEGVFLAQLFQAMRATVPADGAGQAEQQFQAMLDDTLAGQATLRTERGLGEALYRQLARHLDAARAAQETLGAHDGDPGRRP